MVTADGKEILCDKTHNKDLFSAVIGGYGLLGIITEVNLRTTQNSSYEFSLIPTRTHTLIDMLEALSKNPAKCGMLLPGNFRFVSTPLLLIQPDLLFELAQFC